MVCVKNNKIVMENRFMLYKLGGERVSVKVFFEDENIWLSQKLMSELFDVDRTVITKHLKNIFESGELGEKSTVQNLHISHSDRPIKFYNLDAIISVGYRVNSNKATKFRIWATRKLKEYVIKGFVLDRERLKNGEYFGRDYFDELLEVVRSIRASERRVYQKITDIFAECSVDYDKNSEITRNFYASIQNRFHYAISGRTASEIIHQQVDSEKRNMGLNTWRNSPSGRILKSDVIIAKNYLGEKEIKKLEKTVSGFFDYIENIIENHKIMTMDDLARSVSRVFEF